MRSVALPQLQQPASPAFAPVPLVRLIEWQAQQQGDKTAARCQDKSLTYGELNVRANQLAHYLGRCGLQKGERVVVCAPPALEILVAILALHKLGAVYVPVDPGFPINRIAVILDEVQPRLILGLGDCAYLPPSFQKSFIDLTIPTATGATAVENPAVALALDDISHIFFTSGTTGKPKGVVATHANLLHYIKTAAERFGFCSADKFIAAARFTFSISLFELLAPLAVGAEVNLLPREQVLDMAKLSAAVARSTVFHFGPSLLKQLLPYIENNGPGLAAFDHLRHVSSGGDMVPPEILESLKRIFRHAEVYVIYGSSEISCMGCTYPVSRSHTIIRTKVGTPFADVRLKILDAEGRAVSQGAVGQVYFAGPGLVTGYLNQPTLTAEKFLEIDGERYYAIGDVGRFDAEGYVELLGRADFQVQVRGMRVELLEIEQQLKSLTAVSDCVVVAKKLADQTEPTLVGYLVLHEDEAVDAAYIHHHLRQHLPDYMIPPLFVRLGKLPLNHNGKLDRSQLPAPSAANLLLSGGFAAATTQVQMDLLAILQDLFALDSIGIDHSFFELGGDSLTAVRYLMAVDKKYARFIPISFLLSHPTVRELAELLEQEKPAPGVGDVVVLKHGNTDAPLFCLYGVLLYRDLALALQTQRTVCGVYLAEEVLLMQQGTDAAAVQDLLSVDKIAARYLQSIVAFQAKGPYYLAGESFGGIIALEVARLLRERGEEVALVAMLDTHAPGFWRSLSPAQKMLLHMKKILRERGAYFNRALMAKIKHKWLAKSGLAPVVDERASARATASRGYQPRPFTEPVLLFKAKERTEFEPPSADLGWGRYLPSLRVHEVNGDHLGMLREGIVQDLAARLRLYL